MTAKIGILGEDTTLVKQVLVTIYTVPADKAARVKVLFMWEGGTGSVNRYSIIIGSPGTEVQVGLGNSASGLDALSGRRPNSTPDPATAINSLPGVQRGVGILNDMDNPGSDIGEYIVSPLPDGYYLNTGDTVRAQWDTSNLADHLIQVVGVEDDA